MLVRRAQRPCPRSLRRRGRVLLSAQHQVQRVILYEAFLHRRLVDISDFLVLVLHQVLVDLPFLQLAFDAVDFVTHHLLVYCHLLLHIDGPILFALLLSYSLALLTHGFSHFLIQ